jgi:hypothetical protein
MNSGTAEAKAREEDMREETPRSAFATELPVPIEDGSSFWSVCECGEEQCTVNQCERLAEGVRGEVCEERIHRGPHERTWSMGPRTHANRERTDETSHL